MKVTIKYFAICYDMFGKREETMDLPEGASVQDILDRLEARKPEVADLYHTMRLSVNWEYASTDTPLDDGDEVALIPPVAGG